MKLETQREQLLKLLQHVVGVVERRQTLPILSNVLVVAERDALVFTATDLEVELSTYVQIPIQAPGRTTLPARKLLDILRALPDDTAVVLAVEENKALLRCGRSRFSLAALPADEWPSQEELPAEGQMRLPQAVLKNLIERTQFAMAQQDVRYYLNGLLLDMNGDRLRAVATDGHRLALCDKPVVTETTLVRQVIVPRKGVQELARLLGEEEESVADLKVGANHIQVSLGAIRFTSKLIDGRFPDYQRAVPKEGERMVVADRINLRNALSRVAILANENRGVRLQLSKGLLLAQANNPEQEEAQEEIEVDYRGESLEIGFNVGYLLDALGGLTGERVKLFFADANNSCLLQEAEAEDCKYVISPMRL